MPGERDFKYVVAEFATRDESERFENAARDCFGVVLSSGDYRGSKRVFGFASWPPDLRFQLSIFVRGWAASAWVSMRRGRSAQAVRRACGSGG